MKGAAKDPLKVVTDGTAGLVQTETTEDKSTLIGPGDYDNIVAQAHDEAGWMKHVASAAKRPDWRRTMLAIRAASKWREGTDGKPGRWEYDANKVQEALARWTASTDTDRLGAVDYLVRPGGSTEGGVHAAFPGPLASLEPDYKKYVLRDPVGDSKALYAADREQQKQFSSGQSDPAKLADLHKSALADLTDARTHLERLSEGLTGKGGEFSSPGVLGDDGPVGEAAYRCAQRDPATEDQITNLGIEAKAAAPLPTKGGKVDKAAAAKAQAEITTEKSAAVY